MVPCPDFIGHKADIYLKHLKDYLLEFKDCPDVRVKIAQDLKNALK